MHLLKSQHNDLTLRITAKAPTKLVVKTKEMYDSFSQNEPTVIPQSRKMTTVPSDIHRKTFMYHALLTGIRIY